MPAPTASLPEPEPFALGRVVPAPSISIADGINEWWDDLFDGPLTDYEGSDGGEDAQSELDGEGGGVSSGQEEGPVGPSGAAKQTRAARRNENKKERRRRRRALDQETPGADAKGLADKHRMRSAGAPVPTGFVTAASPNVTGPGWVGKRLGSLPTRTFSLQELCEAYPHLTVFPWDGR